MQIFDSWPPAVRKEMTKYGTCPQQIEACLNAGVTFETILNVLEKEQQEDEAKPPG